MTPRDEHDDDAPIGRILTRREVLALLGGLGAALIVGCDTVAPTTTPAGAAATPTQAAGGPPNTAAPQPASAATGTALPAEAATAVAATPVPATPAAAAAVPACVVRPQMTEGPYFVDEKLNRADIRSDPATGTVKPGAPLALTFLVSQVASNACTPLKGAQVDIWHCDAAGIYSDTNDPNWNTVGQKFLRGYQATDANGRAAFTTIYPGWYRGRAVHIHFKIRTTGSNGQAYEFTSQLFFDDALTDTVQAQAPYAAKGQRDTRNSADSIYQGGGDQMLLALAPANGGYATTFSIGLDLSDTATGAPDGNQQNGGGGPGGPPPGGPPGGGPPPGGLPGGGPPPGPGSTPTP